MMREMTEMRGPMEEYPDELRTRTTAGKPRSGPLGDFLWETASWDPAVEELVTRHSRTGPSGNWSPSRGGCLTSGG